MGGYPSKETDIVKAENFNRESLTDHSFFVINVHGASRVGGALLAIAVLLLACLGYAMACYKDHVKNMRHRAITSLEIIKPSCPV